MKSSDKPKLIIALVVLALAGVVFAWQAGLFESGPSNIPSAPADPAKPKSGGGHVMPGNNK